ncbi:FadR/GntR family transcriptional regulator [Cryptosporangium phraense]|uniref:FadR family transcriptional regulator n=1 Tax=Cryptosporangium phraense TaxID=2593070 RepID=A0A545AQ34_9ACTN|nr:FadR/GntR family transcriptional regulator [Cryptosporangium phraense]TQS43447.1 FadR family transcriptional regulator [Cryptosporangium phraense]
MFEPVRPVRAYERVVEQIESALRRGELRAGERLPSERELMRQFQVSRSTIREALRVLESNGLLRSRQGDPQGAELLPLSPETLRRPMAKLARSGEISFEDLLQFRILLDGAASFLAARLHDETQIAEMRAALERLRTAAGAGRSAWSRADVDFHDAIARATGNPLLQVCSAVVRSVATGMIESEIAEAGDSPELTERWVRLHSRLFELIDARDGVEAAAQAQRDLLDEYGVHLSDDRRQLLADWITS